MKEKKARVEDAMHATKAAVEEGIVPGGGVALLRASKVLATLKLEGDEQIGVRIIVRAIEEPMRWIATNAGHEGSIVVQRVKEMKDEEGFNAQTEQYENLVAGRRDRSDEGGALGAAERGVHRLAAADDRSGHLPDAGTAQECRGAGWRNGRHVLMLRLMADGSDGNADVRRPGPFGPGSSMAGGSGRRA